MPEPREGRIRGGAALDPLPRCHRLDLQPVLPKLIHNPKKLAGRLEGAEALMPAEHAEE
jgi:hypothetical protein